MQVLYSVCADPCDRTVVRDPRQGGGLLLLLMMDELLNGRVTSFRREQGFGVITLDDGREIKFDAHICKMLPEEGAAVQLRIAPARWGGGWKATHVEPLGAVLEAAPQPRTLAQRMAAAEATARLGDDAEPAPRPRAARAR